MKRTLILMLILITMQQIAKCERLENVQPLTEISNEPEFKQINSEWLINNTDFEEKDPFISILELANWEFWPYIDDNDEYYKCTIDSPKKSLPSDKKEKSKILTECFANRYQCNINNTSIDKHRIEYMHDLTQCAMEALFEGVIINDPPIELFDEKYKNKINHHFSFGVFLDYYNDKSYITKVVINLEKEKEIIHKNNSYYDYSGKAKLYLVPNKTTEEELSKRTEILTQKQSTQSKKLELDPNESKKTNDMKLEIESIDDIKTENLFLDDYSRSIFIKSFNWKLIEHKENSNPKKIYQYFDMTSLTKYFFYYDKLIRSANFLRICSNRWSYDEELTFGHCTRGFIKNNLLEILSNKIIKEKYENIFIPHSQLVQYYEEEERLNFFQILFRNNSFSELKKYVRLEELIRKVFEIQINDYLDRFIFKLKSNRFGKN
jgi:hypothetical protein